MLFFEKPVACCFFMFFVSSSYIFLSSILMFSNNCDIFAPERDSPEYVMDVGSREFSITRWLIPFFVI